MSDSEKLKGQTYDSRTGRTYPFLQQELDYSGKPGETRLTGLEGTAGADITPTDKDGALTRLYDLAGIITMLEAETLKYVTRGPVRGLPDVLTEVSVEFNKSGGTGTANYPASQQEFFLAVSGSGNINPKATAQASASILPVLMWKRKTHYKSQEVTHQIYVFNIAAPIVTLNDILTKLATAPLANATVSVLSFRPEEHQIRLFGSQVSLRQTAVSSATVNISPSAYSGTTEYGDEYGDERGVNVRVETIPETIHGAITITDPTDTQDVEVTVVANITDMPGIPSFSTPITNEPDTITGTAEGSVSPTTLAATTPSAIPVTGLYLVDVVAQQDVFGVTQVRADVVDFSQYA